MNELLKLALLASQQGRSYAFATIVETTKKGTPQKIGAKMIVLEDGTLVGTIGGGRNERAAKDECLEAIKTGKPSIVIYDFFGGPGQSVCGGQIKVLIEPFVGRYKLVICGGGHIALPLSIIAKMMNFHVTVIDSRIEFVHKSRFPHVDCLLKGDHAKQLTSLAIDQRTFIMIVAHGNEIDYECLRGVIKKDFGYLGVIASLAKKVKFARRLREEKVSAKLISKVRMPAGLDIGALTPEEIANAIIAEMISMIRLDRIGTQKFQSISSRKVEKNGT